MVAQTCGLQNGADLSLYRDQSERLRLCRVSPPDPFWTEFDNLAIFDTPFLRLVQYFDETFLGLLNRKSCENQGYQP